VTPAIVPGVSMKIFPCRAAGIEPSGARCGPEWFLARRVCLVNFQLMTSKDFGRGAVSL
jgi:hypothetical protein